jgi:hypothetical protein
MTKLIVAFRKFPNAPEKEQEGDGKICGLVIRVWTEAAKGEERKYKE